ncbi:MAG: Zn-ribbon domain-containing OB-fold protein [Halobacteriota archaeon]
MDAGYDDWLDAIDAGRGTYLECDEGHGSLPPRRVCPHCGSPSLSETPLVDTGEITTVSVIYVAPPRFEDDVPYATAIAEFGSVRLTGVVRGLEPGAVETGLTVTVGVESTETRDERLLVFRPA